MNHDRVKELAKQIGDVYVDGMGYGEGDIEGLIEAVLLDCIKQLHLMKDEMTADEMVSKGYKSFDTYCGALHDAETRIKNQFGIK